MQTTLDNPQGWSLGLKIGPRPKLRVIEKLGATAVITLQRPEEGAMGIGEACKNLGIKWWGFPLDSRDTTLNSPQAGEQEMGKVVEVTKRVEVLIAEGEQVFVHCAAGIHRTGMVTFTWLLRRGLDYKGAVTMLGYLRPPTLSDSTLPSKLRIMHKYLENNNLGEGMKGIQFLNRSLNTSDLLRNIKMDTP